MNDLMTLDDIAKMNHCTVRHARDVLVKLPGFPAEVQSRGAKRTWKAQEVHNFVNRRPLNAPGLFHLYRHYDDAGTLLYVGVSLSAVARLCEHKRTAEWFQRLRRVDVEWFPTREASIEAEKKAIKAEKPKFNKQHNRHED